MGDEYNYNNRTGLSIIAGSLGNGDDAFKRILAEQLEAWKRARAGRDREAAPSKGRAAPLNGQPQASKSVMGGLKRQAASAPKAAIAMRGPSVARTMSSAPKAAAPSMKLGGK